MADSHLPKRIIAFGEELLGDRINVYHKFEKLRVIIDSLDPFEKDFIKSSPLCMLLEIHNKPAWSTSFALYLLARLLKVKKKHEIWVLFGGYPVRFSLREFKIVTGLPCGKYPAVTKKKKKDTAGKEVPYYATLFGLEEGVSVDRVIDILKNKTISDPQLRLRYACLALVDGFLLPTSHYPKINKDHAEMSKDIDAFVAYPWGRMSFEMIMTSIKERNVKQLATTAVTVHGFLYALQLVLIEAVPSIQEGVAPVTHGPTDSDGENEQLAPPKQMVAFKLAQARELDSLCEVEVTSIIREDVVFDPLDEDVSWSDEEEDDCVNNMVDLIGQGLKFDNSMFKGGVIPSEIGSGTVHTKKGTKARVLRSRKAKEVTNKPELPARKSPTKSVNIRSQPVRRSPRQPARPSVSPQAFDIHVLASMIDEKLGNLESRIFGRITKWISENVVSGDGHPNHSKGSDRGENQPAPKQTFVDKGKGHVVEEDSVEDIVAFYNSTYEEGVGDDVGPSMPAPKEDKAAADNKKHGSVEASGNVLQKDDDSINHRYEAEVGGDHVFVNESLTKKDSNVPDVSKQDKSSLSTHYSDKVTDGDLHHTTTEEIGDNSVGHTEPETQNDGVDVLDTNQPTITEPMVKNTEPTIIPEQPLSPQCDVTDTIMKEAPAPLDSSKRKNDVDENLAEASAIRAEPLSMVAVGKIVDIPVERRSKRARTMSSKIDSRFQCDQQTKKLLGHPLPKFLPTPSEIQSEIEVENRFQESLTKLKTRSNICVGGGSVLTNKDIISLLERKKHLSSKVIDALMKFSRYLLRSDDLDGKQLKVEVFDSQFISQLARVHPKFAKTAVPESFVFPTALLDAVAGRASGLHPSVLFTEVDFIYVPFNFDRKNWVALCLDLRAASILVLDTIVQQHNDSHIASELQPIATMLPYLFRAALPEFVIKSHMSCNPFRIERKLGLAQVTNSVDSGLMSFFLIHAHATGGFEECRAFTLIDIEHQSKKLVCGLLQSEIA